MHQVKGLAETEQLTVFFRTPDGSWVQKFSSSDPEDMRSVASGLSKYGIRQCQPWRSKCPFCIKCEFRRAGSITNVYMGVDGCNQFHFDDWQWQGKFAVSPGTTLENIMDEFRRTGYF
jgi:hypothetical protein